MTLTHQPRAEFSASIHSHQGLLHENELTKTIAYSDFPFILTPSNFYSFFFFILSLFNPDFRCVSFVGLLDVGYIVMSGKVRLLDRTDNLLITLETGASFGESTLFPDSSFQPYAARASINLKLGYLPEQLLQDLIYKYPTIREHLYLQAVLKDWLLLSPQIATLRKEPGLTEVLSLLERHDLSAGKLSDSFGDRNTLRRLFQPILLQYIPYK